MLVPVVACAALVGVLGVVLVSWRLRRRRRQRRIALPVSPVEKGLTIIHDDDDDGDGPAIWDNRPPAASPIPQHPFARGIDSPEYSPTATVFSPSALTFPPIAMEKHNEMKAYEPYTYTYSGWDSPPGSPPRASPRIVVDRREPVTHVSLYSAESVYSSSPSPVPSSERDYGVRALSPTMLDTFPAPPPLAHSAHRSISVPSLRSPNSDYFHARGPSEESQLSPASLHFAAARTGSDHASQVFLPPSSPHFQFPPPTAGAPPSSFPLQAPPPRRRPMYGAPRKQRSLQTSRNSLDIIRERGGSF